MSDPAINSTTQAFLDVYDIINDMVLLKDGTASIILQVGTMNFSLLAEQEQDAVIFTYGSLLNSLNYPIQINIQSQTKDATKYLRLLDEQIEKSTSDRKVMLIKKYRNFVAELIKERNVLEKKFYIIVPASPGEMGLITASGVLPGNTTFDASTVEKSILLEKAANILEPRRDHMIAQFNRLGLFVNQLNTQEIIQNFYINYNPEAVEGQEIASSESYTTPLVRASFGGKPMINQAIQNIPASMQLGQSLQPQAPAQELVAEQEAQIEPPVQVDDQTNESTIATDLPEPVEVETALPTNAPWENQPAENNDEAEGGEEVEAPTLETPVFDAQSALAPEPEPEPEPETTVNPEQQPAETNIENNTLSTDPAPPPTEFAQPAELDLVLDPGLLQTPVDSSLTATEQVVENLPTPPQAQPEEIIVSETPILTPPTEEVVVEPTFTTETQSAPELLATSEPQAALENQPTPDVTQATLLDFSEEISNVQPQSEAATSVEPTSSADLTQSQVPTPNESSSPLTPVNVFAEEDLSFQDNK